MKKIIATLFILTLVIFYGCEEKQLFLFPTLTHQVQYTVDETTGVIHEDGQLALEEINDFLTEIQLDGLIEEIGLEGFAFSFDIYDDNEAETVVLSAFIQDASGETVAIFEDQQFDIANIEEGATYSVTDLLQEEGVQALEDIINGLVADPGQYDTVNIAVDGVSSPSGVAAHMEVFISFRINAKIKP